ncbi:MAG: methyltransferase [Bacteroidaceae bacterium]|nr:methyltransferase [Bacteroidaceae bacterium]
MEFELIAKTFQGLETVLAAELIDLGANNIQIGRRMVSFTGDQEMMYRANFQLRTAIRILKPISHFKATTADEVYEAVKKIDWTQYISNETTFAVDSVVFSNEFRHSKFVAYKVKDAIVDQFREKTGSRPNIRIMNPDIQLHIHVAEYDCTLALDSSGESLHRRGYRQETVEAPLNEVLAAGIILQTGWRGECDLIDPMCGSGTFAVEAALIARGIAPGIFRKGYAFEKWPDFDKELFERIYDDDSMERPFEHHIYGYDNNRIAVEIATRNVKAAGLSKDVTIGLQDFKEFKQPKEKSIIVTNPPYGERISAPDLLGLYSMIGERFKHQFVGGEAWVLSYREECFDAIGLKPSLRTPLYNGSLECELRKYQIFDGKFNEMRAGGGDIKTVQERNLMANHKRFKQNRDFKTRLGEQPEERGLSGDRNFGKGKYNSEDRKKGYGSRKFDRHVDEDVHDDRRFGHKERSFVRKDRNSNREGRNFERRNGENDRRNNGFGHRNEDNRENRFRRNDARQRSFGNGDGRGYGKRPAEKRNNKPFNKFRKDDED